MGFTVDHQCPQCGAPIELKETDRLLHCPYCHVKNFLFSRDCFRFVLPYMATGRDVFLVPYIRLKGNVYFCVDFSIGWRILDITHPGLPMQGLPISLGLRPQAMKLKFLNPEITGSFLRPTVRVKDVLSKWEKDPPISAQGSPIYRAYIGETISIVYLPILVRENRALDALTKEPILGLSGELLISNLKDPSPLPIQVIPTLCPNCGSPMDCERDSVVMICSNCNSAWEVEKGEFVRVSLSFVRDRGNEGLHIPFWRIQAKVHGIEMNSYADFLRITNQPRIVKRQWENRAMCFWIPAFKLRPDIFIEIARHMTVQQELPEADMEGPERKQLYPVTLPRKEAVKALNVTLAASTIDKKRVFPLLPHVRFRVNGEELVYIPFVDRGREIVQDALKLRISRETLNWGRYL